MEQKIKELTEKESAWIQQQLAGAAKLMEIMTPDAAGQPLSVKSLDQAFAAWMGLEQNDTDVTNAVINQVGVGFGQLLTEKLPLRWVIAVDKRGSDLALYGLPGKGDVLIYPANLVAKRWERRETNFLEKCFEETAAQIKALSSGTTPAQPEKKRGFFGKLFGS
jgi:hypothetical protein